MNNLLVYIGLGFVLAIPAGAILYWLSRMQMRGWLDAFNKHFKSNAENYEQKEKEQL
jgi:hypothetical protein